MKRYIPSKSLVILVCALGLAMLPTSVRAASITLTNSDAGNPTYLVSSFTSKGNWNDSVGPTNVNDYIVPSTPAVSMRTPADTTNYVFNGNSLTLSGPGTTAAGGGRLITKNNGVVTYTINNLLVTNLGMIQNGAAGNTPVIIAGSITTSNGGWVLLPGNNQITIAADVAGDGPLWLGSPSAASANTVTFSGAISNYTGSVYSTNNTSTLLFSNNLVQTYSGNLLMSRTNNGVIVRGAGVLTLTGTNAYPGLTTVSNGTLVLAGNGVGVTNSTTVASGATLQLQANANNTVSGTNYCLGTVGAANTFTKGCTLQFRSDSSVVFNGGNSLAGVGNGINTWDVNQLTGAGVSNTITFAPDGFNVFNSTFNLTGGNGYSLVLGPLNGVNTGGTLTLNPSNLNLTIGGVTGDVAGGTTVQGNGDVTSSAAITAVTRLTKQGSGTLTLNGANSYSGATRIQGGTVVLANGTTLASTNLDLSTGAQLDVTALSGGVLPLNFLQVVAGSGTVLGSVDTSYGGSLSPGGPLLAGTLSVTNNLTLSSGGVLSFDLAKNTALGGGTNDLIAVAGDLNVAGSTALTLNFLDGSPATGAYTLIQYGTFSGDVTQIYPPSNPRYTLVVTNNTATKAVELLVSGVPADLVWVGDGFFNGWDNAGSYQNWTNPAIASPDFFYDGDVVTFNDSGSNSPAIYLATVNAPGSVTVNASQDYDFSGSGGIGGVVCSLTKSGGGTLILETANTYGGSTTITAGKLQVGNAGTAGTLGTGPVTNNAALSLSRTDGLIVPNNLHGSGTVSLDSAGTFGFTSTNNDYTGSTLVNAGTLFLTTPQGLGASSGGTVVAAGAQLYINAAVNVGTEPLTLNGAGDGSGALRKSGGNAATFGGAITLGSDTRIKLDGNGTLNLTNAAGIDGSAVNASLALAGDGGSAGIVAGPISLGTNGLFISSGGSWSLNASNSFSGGTTLASGVVNLNANGALGTGPVTATNSGRFVIADGLNVTNAIIATLVNAGTGQGFLMVNNNTNGTVTTVSGPLAFNATSSFGGNFVGPTSSGYLHVTGPITMPTNTYMVVRDGNVRFSGAGSSYPEIRVGTGTTSLGAHDGVATNTVMDIGGAATAFFDLNGFNQKLAGLRNAANPANVAIVTNSGVSLATVTLDLGTGNTNSFGGSIVGGVALALDSGTQTLTKTGTSPLNGLYTYSGNTAIRGGTLAIGAGVTITNTPAIDVAAGATLGVTTAGLTLAAVQTITGAGTVNGNVTGGGVAPGAGIATLTVSGNLALSGVTSIEVNQALNTNDQVLVSGTVTYGGTLAVTNLGGTLTTNDTFTLFSLGASSSNFTNILGSPGPGLVYSFTNGVLSVAASAAPPGATNLTYTFTANQLVLKWPDGQGWRLQFQTNTLAEGLRTNWFDVTPTPTPPYTNPYTATSPTVFYRLTYP